MNEINFTHRNMRYLGQIESAKYDDGFNEIKANLIKCAGNYNDNINNLVLELISEINKYNSNKQKLFYLINKKNFLLPGRSVKS